MRKLSAATVIPSATEAEFDNLKDFTKSCEQQLRDEDWDANDPN
jgi:hypothetical protein